MLPWWTLSDIWQQALQVIKCTVLPRQQTGTHTVLRDTAHGGFSNTYLWHTEKRCKRRAHRTRTFYLRDTLPHLSSSPPGDPSQLTRGKARPTTVLLLPYRKQDLPVSCIPRHHESTLCISPTSPTFLCQPSFCGVLLSTYQRCYGPFLSRGRCPTHQACWPLAFWRDATLPACPVPSHHVRTVQTHAGWWWSPALSGNPHHAPTQPIPTCGLMGCQDHYRSPGLA